MDKWFFDVIDFCGLRQSGGIMNLNFFSVIRMNHIRHIRNGCDDIHIKFPVEAFLYNFHMKQPQKTGSKPKPKRSRRFRLIG